MVNLSLGSQSGAHDGTSALDRAAAGLTGPGRIIAAAAGNEGGQALHARASVPAGGTVTFPLLVSSYSATPGAQNDFMELEAWYEGTESLHFKVISPRSYTAGPVNVGEVAQNNSNDGAIYVDHEQDTVNHDKTCLIDVWDNNQFVTPRSGTWTVEVGNNTSRAVPVELWITLDYLGQEGAGLVWTAHVDETDLVGTPGTSDSVIAVAAYVTKTQWDASDGHAYQYTGDDVVVGRIASWSSPGPRRDGTMKPDVAAPGMAIASSRSASGSSEFADARRITPDGFHVVSQGTSQACPHVTGLAALILQKHPTDGVKEVLWRLRNSARADTMTGAVPNSSYGYGKVDAAAALDASVPVRLLSLTARWEEERAVVRWALAETEPGTRFRVERAPTATGPFVAVSGLLRGGSRFAWTDPDPAAAEPWYRVRALSRTGESAFFGPVRMDPLVARVRLWQNAPNPFAAGTRVRFSLNRPRVVSLKILDVDGRVVRSLVSGRMEEGRHEVSWDGTDQRGRPVASGVYFYRLATPESVLVKRMVVAR